MALTYVALGTLANDRGDRRGALEWTVRCVVLFDEFPHPSTGGGPRNLATLVATLGMQALEESWRRITGKPLPDHVRSFVDEAVRQGKAG